MVTAACIGGGSSGILLSFWTDLMSARPIDGESPKMASERQILANRVNSKKSTGPKTHKGKALASMNALKHGLTAQKLLMPGESAEEFEALLAELFREHRPETVPSGNWWTSLPCSGGCGEQRPLKQVFSTRMHQLLGEA
jgi:hypothetical protein